MNEAARNNIKITDDNCVWGRTDILESDLEQIEYDKNFKNSEAIYQSIFE